MKKPVIVAAATLLLLFMQSGLLRAQGLYFETLRSGKDVPSAKVSYMPGMAKVVTRSGQVVVVRLDKESVRILNPGRKTYSEISFDDLEDKRFANLPPDQRRALERQMARGQDRDNKEADFDVEKSGETKTIDGFKCTKYVLKRDGQTAQTVWATSEIEVADDFHRDAEKLLDRLESALGMQQSLGEWATKIEGFPIRIEGRGASTKITRIVQQAIPESEFSVPPGYTRASEMQQGSSDQNTGKAQ